MATTAKIAKNNQRRRTVARFRTMAHRGELPGITKSSW